VQSGRRRTQCAAPCTSCRRAVPAAELREGAAVTAILDRRLGRSLSAAASRTGRSCRGTPSSTCWRAAGTTLRRSTSFPGDAARPARPRA
jgi:hypothetical protein